MANPERYQFLEAISENEALLKGIKLGDKNIHYIYKTIKRHSSMKHIAAGEVFHPRTPVEDLPGLNTEDLKATLAYLLEEKVIVQLIRLDYDSVRQRIDLTSCFITHPADEPVHLMGIYIEILNQSVDSVQKSILDAEPLTEANLEEDLRTDFESDALPLPEQIPHSVLNPFQCLDPKNFFIIPEYQLIRTTTEDIISNLKGKKLILEVPHYGITPLRNGEEILRFETAARYMTQSVLPRYQKHGAERLEMRQIDMDENRYRLDPFARRTTTFHTRRAHLVKHSATERRHITEERYPGELAVETVLQLSPLVDAIYEEEKGKEIKEESDHFKSRLNETNDWKECIRFLRVDEAASIHPGVWKNLLESRDIVHEIWESPTGTLHIFLSPRPEIFKSVVMGFLENPEVEPWKIFALKEIYGRRQKEYIELRYDLEFTESLEKLVFRTSIPYLPWYLRIFVMFGIPLFKKRASESAMQSVLAEQSLLRQRNEKRTEDFHRRRREQKRRREEELERIASFQRILDRLDHTYFNLRKIPSIREIESELAAPDQTGFQEILNRWPFQKIPVYKNAPPEDSILLHPVDHEWRYRSTHLYKLLEELFSRISEQEKDPARLEIRNRARALQKYLSTMEEKDSSGRGEVDPYRKLEKEIQKKERDRRSGGAFDSSGPGL